jgi:hypothetical protein
MTQKETVKLTAYGCLEVVGRKVMSDDHTLDPHQGSFFFWKFSSAEMTVCSLQWSAIRHRPLWKCRLLLSHFEVILNVL